MRKIYSLVLMTAMLFVGTNVWADDISVVNHTKGTSLSTNDLQAAVDFVGAGDTATITLNNTITISKAIVIPHVTGTINETTNPTVYARTGQRICLDMRGFNIQGDDEATAGYGCFQILKGTLNIKSTAGPSEIKRPKKSGSNNPNKSVITVYGAPWRQKDVVWTILEIGENITLNSNTVVDGVANQGHADNKVYGLCVQDLGALPYCYSDTTKIGYTTSYQDKTEQFFIDRGINSRIKDKNGKFDAACAYGIKVFVRGTIFGHYRGINVVGNINATPQMDISDTIKHRHFANYPYYEHKYPYLKIYSTAHVFCINDGISNDNNGGIYAGGYCVWDISGNVHGQTGIYAKAGDFVLTDATVASDSPHNYSSGDYHSGDVSGSGIFVASDNGYAGGTGITLEGDTKVTGGGAAAITDVLATNAQETGANTSHMTINGGTLEPGTSGEAISMTTGTADVTTVYGGNISGTVIKDDGEGGTTTVTVATLTPTDGSVHVTEVEVDGKTTIVVSDGPAPSAQTTVHDQTGSVTWKSALVSDDAMVDAITGNTVKTLTELIINDTMTWNGTATRAKSQTLTIENGSTLSVGKVIMGSGAQIIVEAGAKLIVTGDKGIVAPKTSNIILHTSETAQAIFLFNPSVTSNRHPNATVEMISSSYRNSATDRHNHRFGIPMHTGVTSIAASPAAPTAFYRFDYENNSWLNIGYINDNTKPAVDLDQMNMPFEYYQLLCNVPSGSTTTFTFTGSLVGNVNAAKTIAPDVWYGICNSYMGEMDLEQIVNSMSGTMSKTIWTYETSGASAWAWKVANLATAIFDGIDKIKPMQAFLIHNVSDDDDAEATLSYEKTVWNPSMGIAGAPSRRLSAASLTSAKMIISSDNGYGDQLLLIQGNDFTSDFDNGYDAEKYFNGDINFYISDSRAMSVLATDNIADTYLGFSCVNGGIYTIDFSNVNGESYDLIDLEANQTIHMTEGASYQFVANDNEQNDYRFRIVPRQEMPTDIETIENGMIKADGVYTITGQYLGDLNVWNALPAGLYIVNGEKKVK